MNSQQELTQRAESVVSWEATPPPSNVDVEAEPSVADAASIEVSQEVIQEESQVSQEVAQEVSQEVSQEVLQNDVPKKRKRRTKAQIAEDLEKANAAKKRKVVVSVVVGSVWV